MSLKKEEQTIDIRKRLSIEICNNFVKRLNPLQSKEIKIGALIAIKNLIKESNINDPFLYSYLVDTITDPEKETRNYVIKIIKEITNPEIVELLEMKVNDSSIEIKKEIKKLLQELK